MALLALVFASAGASARADVIPKPHVGGIDLAVASVIGVNELASAEEHRGKRCFATTGTSDVPLAARGAARTTPNAIGKAGELAVQAAHNIGPKVRIAINGRNRIPDGLTNSVLSEVKNVKSLSFTRQLRDFSDFAVRTGRRFDLFVRPSTKLSGPLQEAVQQGTVNLRFIP